MMITYTHICMNCGPQHRDGVAGAPTRMVDGRCERCGSEAITPLPPVDPYRDPLYDDRRRLEALEVFHEEIMREKETQLLLLNIHMRELRDALAAYRANHPKCKIYTPGDQVEEKRRKRGIDRRCGMCKRADALLQGRG